LRGRGHELDRHRLGSFAEGVDGSYEIGWQLRFDLTPAHLEPLEPEDAEADGHVNALRGQGADL
jgi:hypothetical protein